MGMLLSSKMPEVIGTSWDDVASRIAKEDLKKGMSVFVPFVFGGIVEMKVSVPENGSPFLQSKSSAATVEFDEEAEGWRCLEFHNKEHADRVFGEPIWVSSKEK